MSAILSLAQRSAATQRASVPGGDDIKAQAKTWAQTWAKTRDLIGTRAFRRGDFTLASGRRSPYYFNLKPIFMSAEGSRLLGALLAEKAARLKPDMLGGMEMGAIPLTVATLLAWPDTAPPPAGFFVRKQAKAHGMKAQLEGLGEGDRIQGRHAVILDDVATTGGSILKAIEVLRREGGEVSHIVAVVDRCEGAKETLAGAGVSLQSLFTPKDF